MKAFGSKSYKEVALRLTNSDVRPLTHRVTIYHYLLTHLTHPTVDNIYSDLVQTMPSLSKTTVYNVLDLLCEKGLVKQLTIEGNEARYDADMEEHMHFKCSECKTVFDLKDVPFPSIELPSGLVIEHIQLNIEGKCSACAKAC
ncbi:MAG: Fur family transcriptional regulator [Sphaerochaetaceae bacterium]|jgi:Fe2+ or Zn2+ uptake regulation protein|nr:transcriptional repressor [Sphaerochaetaceae bacterium]NLO60740.1 transcriptional repressor [Spirochaetales bacterium]MDD2406923.1 Fur family transcriptional regulator [Sphaerochaetaceae bacterium]MDD4260184.1 Fur family transcriptional regulator [Sphaerochaetaceae bacterium]MDD4762465.1 Fur family transcriptional regulator [Sphaerochaetaceae bacterium]